MRRIGSSSGNYPPGVSAGTPGAPWNAPDPPECPECEHLIGEIEDHEEGCELADLDPEALAEHLHEMNKPTEPEDAPGYDPDPDVRTDGGRGTCSECGATLPREIDEGAGVYCPECGTGQHVTDGGQPDVPGGDVPGGGTPYTVDSLEDLLHGAELREYSEGHGPHRENVMAVLDVREEVDEFDLIGISFRSEPSDWPDSLIGERLASIDVIEDRAVIEFNETAEYIAVRGTVGFGVYEVRPRALEEVNDGSR